MSERSKRQRFSISAAGSALIILMILTSPSLGQDITKQPNAPADSTLTDSIGGFFGGVWNGVVDVVTLKVVFGDDQQAEPTEPGQTPSRQPWDRRAEASDNSGSMSRMMNRMADVVGGGKTEEDEFGLPK